MYTGLIAGTGAIAATTPADGGCRLRVDTGGVVSPAPGDSVAVAGVCLTAERTGERWFEAFLSAATVDRTYLADLAPGDAVNLEAPLRAGDPLDGHVVRGTVDTTTTVAAVEADGETTRVAFWVPDGFAPFLAGTGAVAVDGASLTVTEVDDRRFAVALVPETRERTTFSELSVDERVHLEADPLARYARARAGEAA